jgi:hypothetical protein
MFTWICPQCGREVPPAYNECPDCAEKAKQAPAAAAPPPQAQQPPPPPYATQPVPQYAPPPPPQYAPPPAAQYAPPPAQPQYAPPPPQYQAPQYQQPPPPHRGMNMPVWLMTILFALAIGGVVIGALWVLSTNRGSAGNGPRPSATVESPAAKPGATTNPMQKYIEVSGVRFVQDARKRTMAKFVIVNHSDSDIIGLAGNVTVWGRTQKSEEDAQGTFSFSTNLGPMETQELTVPLKTKLKIYELPDWQNITTDVQITAPPA